MIVTDWKKKWIDVYYYYIEFYNDKFMKFCKKNVCKKICVHERSKNPVFLWQEYYDQSLTFKTLLRRCYNYQVHYLYNNLISWKKIMLTYEITLSCEYMLCTWLLKMRRLKKNTRFTTYYYKYTTEKNPKLRAVEGNKTFGINFFVAWFYLFFWETVIIFT